MMSARGSASQNDYANPVAARELPFQKPVIGNSGSAFCSSFVAPLFRQRNAPVKPVQIRMPEVGSGTAATLIVAGPESKADAELPGLMAAPIYCDCENAVIGMGKTTVPCASRKVDSIRNGESKIYIEPVVGAVKRAFAEPKSVNCGMTRKRPIAGPDDVVAAIHKREIAEI